MPSGRLSVAVTFERPRQCLGIPAVHRWRWRWPGNNARPAAPLIAMPQTLRNTQQSTGTVVSQYKSHQQLACTIPHARTQLCSSPDTPDQRPCTCSSLGAHFACLFDYSPNLPGFLFSRIGWAHDRVTSDSLSAAECRANARASAKVCRQGACDFHDISGRSMLGRLRRTEVGEVKRESYLCSYLL